MTDSSPFLSVVVPAAGSGVRLDAESPKAFLPLAGTPMFVHAVTPFLELESTVEIVLVQPPGASKAEAVEQRLPDAAPVRVVDGGASRFASVRNGVRALTVPSEHVLVHDAARPFVNRPLIDRVRTGVGEHGAAIPVRPIPDTIKRVRDGVIRETVDRDELFRAQTPQGFRRDRFENALEQITPERAEELTDDASVVSEAGHPVHTVPGAWYNLKITYPEDLKRAEKMLEAGWVKSP